MKMRGRLLIGSAAAAVTMVGAAALAWPDREVPRVDPRLRTEVVPLIQRHLEDGNTADGVLANEQSTREPRLFCNVRLIEARHRGADLLAGVYATCEELAPRGNMLLTGSGASRPMLVTLRKAGGARQVIGVEEPLDGAGFGPSVERMFTRNGAAEAFRLDGRGSEREREQLEDRARRVFGLPEDAAVQQP